MTSSAEVLRRLREEPAHLEALCELAIEHALDRPLTAVLDPAALARVISSGLTAMAGSPELEGWLETRATRALDGVDELEGAVGEHMPATALGPIEAILRREVMPDPELVARLIDHPSLRVLMRDVMQRNLLDFARRLRDLFPGGASAAKAGRGLGGMLGAVAKNVATAAGSAVEKQLEERAKGFVDDALGVAIESTIQRFSDPDHAKELASFRIDVFHALLQEPVERLLAERHKYPPADFAKDAASLIRTFASWNELGPTIESGAQRILAAHGDETARAWLEGSGLGDGVRDELRAFLVAEARSIVSSGDFGEWLDGLLAADD